MSRNIQGGDGDIMMHAASARFIQTECREHDIQVLDLGLDSRVQETLTSVAMVSHKRKRSIHEDIDISSSLTGSKPKRHLPVQDDDSDTTDEELNKIIQQSIVDRNVKEGTQFLKRTKGKAKAMKGEVGGGSFQSMGLHPSLLRSLTLQGYRIPTPIQRLCIPALLKNPPSDLVGMARTGSGKSLAYMVPLLQRLGGRRVTAFGARALILLPTRELALQILKVGKELARGWNSAQGGHAGDAKDAKDSKKNQNPRWALVVGGESMDDQFEMITNNPDIIIATPGRLLHLIVEMNMDLKSVQYVVFDEADRLFEMGFETALNEILHRLSSSRQTLLFSATLPKSLVEFAKAGLQDPKLVRLDAESKISSDLRMAFFSVKQTEKDACLLALLRDVIRVPLRSTRPLEENAPDARSKSKGNGKDREHSTKSHQTLVFTATKHHVEYLTNLLMTVGYAVSHIYSSLDQSARKLQMDRFRRGITSILVVTDVAARGIDIPILENVVNYDFPQGSRVFVHRVGRTARAGRQGWAWSFVTHDELPHLLDLQLFLGRPLRNKVDEDGDHVYIESLVLGIFRRETIDEDVEYLRSLEDINHSLPQLREVMNRGYTLYKRSKSKASSQSYQRAKEMINDPKWLLAGSDSGIHPVLTRGTGDSVKESTELARKALLQAVSSFRPAEMVFETGNKGNTVTSALMRERRKALHRAVQRAGIDSITPENFSEDADQGSDEIKGPDIEMADEDDIAAVFHTPSGKKSAKDDFRDSEFYLSYYPEDAYTEKGYSLTDGASSFAQQARGATFDLAGDEGSAQRKKPQLNWDKKKKRFIKGDGVGADNVKLVKTENGTRLPATYRSGRFDEWKSKHHVSLPNVGDSENAGRSIGRNAGLGGRFKHNKTVSAKPLDKRNTDFKRKARQLKKKEEAQRVDSNIQSESDEKRKMLSGRRSRYSGKPIGNVKNELKNRDQIRKERRLKMQRRAKNARPSRVKRKIRR